MHLNSSLCRLAGSVALFLVANLAVAASLKPLDPRKVVDLNGTWEVEQGSLVGKPTRYGSRIVVPGLVDLAKPGFANVGLPSDLRQAFWYRRVFKIKQAIPEIAQLKLHKAKYGTKIWLNSQLVAEHLPCFTPGYFDVTPMLRGEGQDNELIIRVGADRTSLPQDMPTGWDFEKYRYIPGIYDSVEVILGSRPYIRNVQLVPDIDNQQIRVVAHLEGAAGASETRLEAKVRHAKGWRRVAGQGEVMVALDAEGRAQADFTVPIKDCRLWSPEDPFLYELELRTPADAAKVRFGMRTFSFDPVDRYARLNGKRYFLRGSNVTLYRFFEDAPRERLPWDEGWVRKLHRRFKDMHWNSLRYCIGFPPELWYDIADEEGLLIQDEFPIWLLSGPKSKCPEFPVAEKIIPEYRAWMQERWNHPSVVIWDAQNESFTPETGKALQAVRHLDLSNRPWENGWAEPQADTDVVESHPYFFINDWQDRPPFRLSRLATTSGVPRLHEAQKKRSVPILINEYAWLWLTRDGDPTCLTDKIYLNQLGAESTVEQRRMLYARYLAALTEFWRAHRECAGILHFCGLGYSRPGDRPRPEGGATSDHWLDLKRLKWEPLFSEYVRESFNPLGIMLNYWAEEAGAGSQLDLEVYLTNDLDTEWTGDLELLIAGHGDEGEVLAARTASVPGHGREIVGVQVRLPDREGRHTLFARIKDSEGRTVRSLRDLQLVP